MTHKHNQLVAFGEKRASVHFKSRDMVHEHHKINSAFLLAFVTTMLVLSACVHNYKLVKVVNNASRIITVV